MDEFIVGAWLAYWFAVTVKISMACFLEWKLSCKAEWYLGLVLPFIFFWDSLSAMVARPEGEWLAAFAGANAKTLLLLAFYGVAREQVRRKREMQEMKLKDLG